MLNQGITAARSLAVLVLVALGASACTSTDVLEPSAIAADPSAGTTDGLATVAPPAISAGAPAGVDTSQATTAAIPRVRRLQLAPVVGTPVPAAEPLAERLALRARERGLPMVRQGETPSHVLKGYFSALPEGKQTTIVFVWDVLDGSGNRLHRIQGQQTVPGGKGWASVPASTMESIADQTMEQFSSWLGGRTG